MSFNEKLQILRKEMKLSQEQLADKLNVSRQAVSKWESGASYPEMDKLIALCKLFKCSIDDLTNTDVKELGTTYNKNNLNSIVDELLFMIKKSITMITTMKTKSFISMIFSMGFVFLCILALKIPIDIIYNMGNRIFYIFGSPIGELISSIWYFILNVGYMILAILLFFYIYKVKYLDNYEEKTKEIIIETKTESNEPKKEKIIITNAPASEKRYVFFNILGKLFTLFMKFIIILFSIPFIIILLVLFALLVIEIGLIFKGISFLGIILGTISIISIAIMILYLIIHALFETKINIKYVLINSLVSISMIGIAIGMTIFKISSIEFSNKIPNVDKDIIITEYDMQEELKINTTTWELAYGKVNYNIDNNLNNKVIIKVEYPKEYFDMELNKTHDNFITLFSISDLDYEFTLIKQVINDLKNNKINNYDFSENIIITITTSQSNIDKIENNTITYLKKEAEENNYNYYNNTINDLEREINNKQQEIDNLNKEIENLNSKNEELINDLEEYKEKLNQIKDTINH